MEPFPDNSKFSPHAKPPAKKEKDIKAVVTGEVRVQKRPLGQRMAEMFTGDSAKGTWQYVVLEVFMPAVKDMVLDAVSQGAERMLFGEARSGVRRGGYRPGQGIAHTAYNRMYGNATAMPRETAGPRTGITKPRGGHDFGEVILPTRVEAQEVLSSMYELLRTYEQVSIPDLYSLLGMEPTHTDFKFGWLSLEGSDIKHVRDGYVLVLPRPEALT